MLAQSQYLRDQAYSGTLNAEELVKPNPSGIGFVRCWVGDTPAGMCTETYPSITFFMLATNGMLVKTTRTDAAWTILYQWALWYDLDTSGTVQVWYIVDDPWVWLTGKYIFFLRVASNSGGWTWPVIWTNVHAILSPFSKLIWWYDTFNSWFAIHNSWWKTYYMWSYWLWYISNTPRSITWVTCIAIDDWSSITNHMCAWWGTVAFAWTRPNSYEYRLDWTDIHCDIYTDFNQHRYITFDTITETFNSVSWSSAIVYDVWFNNMVNMDNVSSINSTTTWTLLTNSYSSWWFTYSTNIIWFANSMATWWWTPQKEIWWIFVAIKV